MIEIADMMKHKPGTGCSGNETCRSLCPMKCNACRYEKERYPARFHKEELEANQSPKAMNRRTHHIVFLFDGSLRIRCKTKEEYSLTAGQCILLSREKGAVLTACEPSLIVWLDFSNRIVFGCQDYLNRLSGSGHLPGSPPILPIDPMLSELVKDMPLIDSPCYHLLKEHELFMVMRFRYGQKELSVFFRSILCPAHDLRAFVLSHYREVQGVEDFARKANLSESTFIRRFREEFGMTVHQWLMKQREKDLHRMIKGGERNTKKLADGIGMSGTAGLYQFCRKRFGCPVTELLNRYSDDNQ